MSTRQTNLTSTVLIAMFFLLFLGIPGYIFQKAYTVYSLKNLPVLTLDELQKTETGKTLTGLLILDIHPAIPAGQKLASFYVHPHVRRYRRFDPEIQPMALFDGSAVLKMSSFPYRFDYGPDLGALDFMIDGSMLESTLTNFGDKGWGGIIRTYETTEQGHAFTEYTVIIDSLSGNRTIVTDTISITKGVASEKKADFCSFDTTNFSGSRNYYSLKIKEKGLTNGDTIVGTFDITKESQMVLSPINIYCYGNPEIIWQEFYHRNKFFLLINAILFLIPILVLANLLRQKMKLV